MNKLYLISFLFLWACTPTPVQKNASIAFAHTEHNFGTLQQKQKAGYDFVFTNTGKEPLIIQNVETSCGCTVPEWTKQPVKPGEKGKIRIKYDTSYPGTFSKSITVYYNGKNSPAHLKIRGNVAFSGK
jgi:hypothetical protein